MQAFTAASEFLGGKFLGPVHACMSRMEPCPMCAGAAFWTRIGRVVYGARDHKRGRPRFHWETRSEGLLHPPHRTRSVACSRRSVRNS